MELYEFHHLIVNGMGGSQRLLYCVLLRAGRHARSARHFQFDLDGADGASYLRRGLTSTNVPHHVPEPVLALHGCDLDLRIHCCLSDGAM